MSATASTIDDRLIDVLAPAGLDLDAAAGTRPLQPFAPDVLALLARVSEGLMTHPSSREFADVVTFGFWCRKASLHAMKQRYVNLERRLGRGVVFHVAPSNVPVNFAYSLAAGLLAGNANIVRVPSADFAQIRIISDVFDAALGSVDHRGLRDHVRLVRYDKRHAEVTSQLSRQCDARVIWGGDESIDEIRRSRLPQRSFDVTFADRYSMCVIDAGRYLTEHDSRKVAQGFYNDTYLFDQNACTAPHLLVWLGSPSDVERAKDVFWDALHDAASQQYELQQVAAVDKLTTALRYAATHVGTRLVGGDDNLVTRIEIDHLERGIDEWRGTWGCFFEYHATDLEELGAIVTRRYQTLSYVGVDPAVLQDFVVAGRITGIDRIVPVGRTLDFTLEWDGFDLIETLSRVIAVQ